MSGIRSRDTGPPAGMTRGDLQMLAQEKLDDARLLLQHQRFSSAYYIGGYAVEFALKACIATQFGAEVIPDKDLVNKIYRHELRALAELAGLARALKAEEHQNADFAANWALVSFWTPEWRYKVIDPGKAHELIHAIGSSPSGVMPWIQARW